jgi:hypothetical protein
MRSGFLTEFLFMRLMIDRKGKHWPFPRRPHLAQILAAANGFGQKRHLFSHNFPSLPSFSFVSYAVVTHQFHFQPSAGTLYSRFLPFLVVACYFHSFFALFGHVLLGLTDRQTAAISRRPTFFNFHAK